MSTRILVVDDEPITRTVISHVLAAEGHQVVEAVSGEEALDLFRENPFPIVITDIVMEKMSGLDLLHEVRLLDPEAIVVVITSYASLETATAAIRSGAYDYLTKPFDDASQIAAVTRRAVDRLRLLEERREMVDRLRRSAEELESLNVQLKEMAARDGLTGLYNHRFFREALEVEVQRSRRHHHVFSLIFADVDQFKRYNDTHGHLQGDRLLRSLATLIEDRSRSTTLAARYGGEEFVLVAPETDKEGGRQYAELIREMVEAYPFEGRESQPGGRITVSFGVATFPEDGRDGISLIASADRALYQAKREGGNLVCCAVTDDFTSLRR